jgi:hypothetical protein
MVFGGPPADSPEALRTEMTVQLTLSSLAHPDDVAAVIDRLQAAIKDAAVATGGRLDIRFALPDIVREERPAANESAVTSSAP